MVNVRCQSDTVVQLMAESLKPPISIDPVKCWCNFNLLINIPLMTIGSTCFQTLVSLLRLSIYVTSWLLIGHTKQVSNSVFSFRVAVLAFHAALSDQPRSPLVVAAFSLAVNNGGNMIDAISIARSINREHNVNFHELLEPENLEVQALIDEVMDLTTSVKAALLKMTDEHFVSLALEMYPQAPASDLVTFRILTSLFFFKILKCINCRRFKVSAIYLNNQL